MEKKIFLITIFLIIIVTLTIILFLIDRKGEKNLVCFENHCFQVELALTPTEYEYGLMFRKSLDADKGMLFIFKEEGEYPFWMKNTLIPLDIIWIDKNKEVVFINKNTKPCEVDSCPIINPNRKAQYVLELSGGMVDKIGLNVGEKIIFK